MQKNVVVTGGTKGIGKALVDKFLSEGYRVLTCARDTSILEVSNTNLEALVCDVSTKKGQLSFVNFVKEKAVNKVDVLINNTGVYVPGQVHNEDDGVLELMINTNLYSAYTITRGLVPQMIDRKSGHIFNICSTASVMPYVNGGSYCISKYAMYGMTKVLREELKDHNVKVTAILPGATFTSSFEGTDLPEERFMKPSDVADSVYAASLLSINACVEEIMLRPQLGDL